MSITSPSGQQLKPDTLLYLKGNQAMTANTLKLYQSAGSPNSRRGYSDQLPRTGGTRCPEALVRPGFKASERIGLTTREL
jgi:hypothetical protein